jgi:hypothetical protein
MRFHPLLTQRTNACIPSPIAIPPGVGGRSAELQAVSARCPRHTAGIDPAERNTDGATGTFHGEFESKATCCSGWLCGFVTVSEAPHGVAGREVDLGNLVKMNRNQPLANDFLGLGGWASTLQWGVAELQSRDWCSPRFPSSLNSRSIAFWHFFQDQGAGAVYQA